MSELATIYLRDIIERFQVHKKLGEKAIAQVYDSKLNTPLDEESNSIAVLVKHLAGNMQSRWVGFFTSDGEKPTRNRDGEFIVDRPLTREELLDMWDDGWARLFETLDALKSEDLTRTVTIRGSQLTAIEALNTALAHYAYHVGQMVQLARYFAGASWKSLSIPKAKKA
ncbi:MAG TPA: DUF1572 family protein [Gemmatimonadales bacterium]|nr:DUF1572 family protein [Gemmatimonadales bacterium]